jgi:Transposase DNA-binding/Transposase DDE domain
MKDWSFREFEFAKVKDKRENKSLINIAQKLGEQPELSFSAACGEALRKAAWRIFSQTEIDLLSGHLHQTILRCAGSERLLVIQDTTDINYQSHTHSQGLGSLGKTHQGQLIQGLSMHTALVLNAEKEVLGILGQKIWAPQATRRAKKHYTYPIEEKESYRWLEVLGWVNTHLSSGPSVLVIADREADFYEYLAYKRQPSVDLLVRVHHLHRWVEYQGQRCQLAHLSPPWAGTIEVNLPARGEQAARVAQVEVSFCPLICPVASQRKGKPISLYFITALEKDDQQTEPLQWYLFTTQTITTFEQACQVIEDYKSRWLIERWHFVLKQGLQIEKLQFDNFQRLKNALHLYSVVAWQLFWLKNLAQNHPQEPAETYFEPPQMELLRAHSQQKLYTVLEAVLVIAKLGGFVPSKKQALPGEKTLWRGWRTFQTLYQGWLLAKQTYGTG